MAQTLQQIAQGRIVLGAAVEDAVASPQELSRAAALFKSERFIITYRHDSKRVRALVCRSYTPAGRVPSA